MARERSGPKISRRKLLGWSGATLGAAVASSSLGANGLVASANAKSKKSGFAGVHLDVGRAGRRYTYNGKSPGPTIYTNPGEVLDVHLTNSLPALDDDCVSDHNNFHGLNTTNLHTHGLHVSPATDSSGRYDADNMFLEVVPREQRLNCGSPNFRRYETRYRFEIPADHPTGTFWYHAHKHGSTNQQVGGGLFGPLVVKDRPGAMPSYIENAVEQIFMITNRGLVSVDPAGGGEHDPTITMRPGEVQRWRIINAATTADSFVHVSSSNPSLELHQIAFDGITLSKRHRVLSTGREQPWLNPAALSPGNRMDLMVRVPPDAATGLTMVSALRSLAHFLHLDGVLTNTEPVQLAVRIAGPPVDHEWSEDDTLPGPGPGLPGFGNHELKTRTITFGPGFRIDGEAYSGQVRQTMKLGESEEWTVRNNSNGVHPYHIHVNPFFVTHIDGVELAIDSPLRRWQDTIALPVRRGREPGSVTFRTNFKKFRGKFVIHCHILRHEDLGMMQAVEVV